MVTGTKKGEHAKFFKLPCPFIRNRDRYQYRLVFRRALVIVAESKICRCSKYENQDPHSSR